MPSYARGNQLRIETLRREGEHYAEYDLALKQRPLELQTT